MVTRIKSITLQNLEVSFNLREVKTTNLRKSHMIKMYAFKLCVARERNRDSSPSDKYLIELGKDFDLTKIQLKCPLFDAP